VGKLYFRSTASVKRKSFKTKEPGVVDLYFLNGVGFSVPNADGIYEIPFVDRMGFVFLICLIVMYFISRYETKNGVVTNELEIEKSMFKMSPGFTVDALIITGILVALYPVFW
jgi:SSS family solute:Na+ symporter